LSIIMTLPVNRSIVIRKLVPADYRSFLNLIDENVNPSDFQRYMVNNYVLVMELDNALVGTGKLLVESKIRYGFSKVGHIEDVMISASHRGNGYGKMLVKELRDVAQNLGCYKVILNCHDHLIKFYESAGFQKTQSMMHLLFPQNFQSS